MHKIIITVLATCLLTESPNLLAQQTIKIPAYTAYAVPADQSTETEESNMFSANKGLFNWSNDKQEIQFYFKLKQIGQLNIALSLKGQNAGQKIDVGIAQQHFKVAVPVAFEFKKITVGSVVIKDSGFYCLTIKAANKTKGLIADILALELSGPAIENIHVNLKTRKNAASVHLRYPLPDSCKVSAFYNEVTVATASDIPHSYFMACGFARGYFGMQVISPTERRIIFSVWDAGNEAIDRNKVGDENKVQLLAKGDGVYADGFGNEGTGGHSHWVYPWKANETYRFLVTTTYDSAKRINNYAGYFFVPETQSWKLIACFRAPKDGKPLNHLYSFSENFDGSNGQFYRQSFFGNQWVRCENGSWKEISKASFSYDETGRHKDRIDVGAGVWNNKFVLWHGGFKNTQTNYGDEFSRMDTNKRPIIDLYKNIDSAVEIEKEKTLIDSFLLKAGDTIAHWNVSKDVYYKILKEGNGEKPAIIDTLEVIYKGQLFNGFIFDETKDKSINFPLNRLIKGWQIGLIECREGGKIRLIIPSYLAYSIRNLMEIPPNSPLIFDVEVIKVKKAGEESQKNIQK